MAVLALALVIDVGVDKVDRSKLRYTVAVSLLGEALIEQNPNNVFMLILEQDDSTWSRASRDTSISDEVKAELTKRGVTVGALDTVFVQ